MLHGPEIQRIALELVAIERERVAPGATLDTLIERAERVLADARRLRIREQATLAATQVARLLSDAGRTQEAARVVERHEPELGWLRDRRLGIGLLRELVRALAALARAENDPAQARARWMEVDHRAGSLIEIVERHRRGVTPIAQMNAFAGFFVDIYAAAVEARLALGDEAGALRIADLVKCRSANRLSNAKRAGDGALEDELRELSRAIDEASRAGRPPSPDDIARRRALWELIAIDRFATSASELDLHQLQSRLPPEMAVVSWFWLDRCRLLVAAFDAREVVTAVETFSNEEREVIDARAKAILELRELPRFDALIELAPELFARLLPPTTHAILSGKTRLVLSPHRSLHALPLSLLRWTDERWLVRTFALSYAPNLTLLMRSLAPPRADRSVLFVGVPERAGPRTARLRGATREEGYVRASYDPAWFVSCLPPSGSKAELEGWNRAGELERFATLHFACHGVNGDPDNPMESRLLLHDADVDGLELSAWRLDADLVVLSACQSGQRPVAGRGLQELPGDELFGLQAAFIAAGARQIVGALWPIEDATAALICDLFHQQLREAPPDVALQRALCELIEVDPICRRMPGLWASFFLTTAGLPPATTARREETMTDDDSRIERLFSFELVLSEGADREGIEERLRERIPELPGIEAARVLGPSRSLDPASVLEAIGIAVLVLEGSSQVVAALTKLVANVKALATEIEGVEEVRIETPARSFSLDELDGSTMAELANSARS